MIYILTNKVMEVGGSIQRGITEYLGENPEMAGLFFQWIKKYLPAVRGGEYHYLGQWSELNRFDVLDLYYLMALLCKDDLVHIVFPTSHSARADIDKKHNQKVLEELPCGVRGYIREAYDDGDGYVEFTKDYRFYYGGHEMFLKKGLVIALEVGSTLFAKTFTHIYGNGIGVARLPYFDKNIHILISVDRGMKSKRVGRYCETRSTDVSRWE